MKIRILGSGGTLCDQLEQVTRQVVDEVGAKAEIEVVGDMKEIKDYPLSATPILLLDGELVSASGECPANQSLPPPCYFIRLII